MKKGISLIVLVITIIVIIILSGAVILSLSNNNPINSATEAAFKQSVQEYNSALALYLANQYSVTIPAGTYNPAIQANFNSSNIDIVIPNIKTEDKTKYEIQAGKLVYVGSNTNESTMISSMGLQTGTVTVGLGINNIATNNVTVNGFPATYNNPIIPKGFKAINTADASWNNLISDWNNGLVIQDASGNEFVWVPIDGGNVIYSKWQTPGIAANNFLNLIDDTTPVGFDAANISTTYKGFYIARYESMFDYNGGNLRVASKVSINKTTTNWSSTRDITYNGYLWNYINYTDAKTYSENMDTAYSYDTSKVGTNLVTGAQWDTVMKWIQNSGTNVMDSRAWGNYIDSIAPANVSGFGSLQVSGYNNNWKSKNIYDLAGNIYEWSNEIYGVLRIRRGSNYLNSGSSYPAAYRTTTAAGGTSDSMGFRVALYVI